MPRDWTTIAGLSAIPEPWRRALGERAATPQLAALGEFLAEEYRTQTVYPAPENTFAALAAAEPSSVGVVLLGQDPYHGPGQAHGLSFSVQQGQPLPPSLRNIFRELANDLGSAAPTDGDLTRWARQGVLLLNTVLTVRQGEAGSHRGRGWEPFTDDIIAVVNRSERPVVFLLWGADARKKRTLIDPRHTVLEAAHPSPLSVAKFRGSRPFSQANDALVAAGRPPVDWLANNPSLVGAK